MAEQEAKQTESKEKLRKKEQELLDMKKQIEVQTQVNAEKHKEAQPVI